jgi:hypothetical protein
MGSSEILDTPSPLRGVREVPTAPKWGPTAPCASGANRLLETTPAPILPHEHSYKFTNTTRRAAHAPRVALRLLHLLCAAARRACGGAAARRLAADGLVDRRRHEDEAAQAPRGGAHTRPVLLDGRARRLHETARDDRMRSRPSTPHLPPRPSPLLFARARLVAARGC